ncbi:thioredoxin peroxidase/alkyl hydroperoxide reductase [Penicillium frequentans]|nr:thioredoxin peroxidase/alkyl hydroperoxide reductase [Penicillium glabrum]
MKIGVTVAAAGHDEIPEAPITSPFFFYPPYEPCNHVLSLPKPQFHPQCSPLAASLPTSPASGPRPPSSTRPRPLSFRRAMLSPDLNVLVENSPGNQVNLAKELKGKGVIVGVPAAFSPACSSTHVPGFINHPKLKEAGQVFVVAVNDPFVTKAWAESLDPNGKSGIRFLGDPTAKFSEALDLTFDSTAIFGNIRSKRYALLVEDGKVKEAFVEPDNAGLNVSAAEKVLDLI